MKVKIQIKVGNYNGTMGFAVRANRQTVWEAKPNELSEGLHDIKFNIDPHTKVDFIAFGKNSNKDTEVFDDGTMGRDKFIEIQLIVVQGVIIERHKIIENIFDPYFSINEAKTFYVPSKEELPMWYLEKTAQ